MKDERYYTELDIHLQNLAASDWPTFVQLVGEKAIRNAKICVLKRRGKSLNGIANRLRITKRIAEENCKKCHLTRDSKG